MNKYVAIGVVAILLIGGGWWYFSQLGMSTSSASNSTTQAPSTYKNSVLGLTFSIPTDLTVVEKDHYRGNDPRSYLITVANSNSSYYARLWANTTVEGTMGPDDVAPTVATSSVSINGIETTKSVNHYVDTGSTYITFSLKSGADWYYFSFPYSSAQEQAYSDKIIQTIQFR